MKLRTILFACFLIVVVSCEKESALDRYYNQEGNFSGSIYDALDSTGINTYFLLGIDSTDFANQLKNTLVTVVAPTDNAFEDYLAKHGYSSFNDIPKTELEDLIGQHIITWPHSPTSFELDPYYFKRQSNMAQRTTVKHDPVLNTDNTIVKEAKYLQFYFPEMLDFYDGTTEDYELLTGKQLSPATSYNLYDIPVDSIVPYGNGWVYYTDEVLEPVQNLDDWLLDAEDYSLFRDLYNRYNLYYVDGVVNSRIDVKRSNLFQNQRYYRIDMELCFETVGYIKTGQSLISLKGASNYTVVAPKNDALEGFIDTYFKDYPGFRESLSSVDNTSLESLHIHKIIRSVITPYMFIDQIVFPSNFTSDEGVSGFGGTNLKFSEQDFSDYALCSNGYAYGVNKYIVPRTFESILKPIFTSPDYKYFTSAVLQTDISGFLNDKNATYTLMLPTDSAFLKNNIVLLDVFTYNMEYGGTINTENGLTETVFLDLNTTPPTVIDDQALFDIVFAHLFLENITPTAEKQYAKCATGSYVGITQDSIWSGGNMEERWDADTVIIPNVIKNLPGGDNGQVYVIDELIKAPTYTVLSMLSRNPAYSRFYDLCVGSRLIANGRLNVYGDYPAVFIPTNEALDQFISEGKLPSDEEKLQSFLKYFFVDQTIYSSQSINETVPTLCKDEELSTDFNSVYKTIEVIGSPGNLQIKGTNNTTFLNVIEGNNSNIICTDGAIHLIDGVLN